MTTFVGFDRIRIINLPTRTDRRSEMMAEIRRIGLENDPRIEFQDGVLVEKAAPFRAKGEKGVFLAHLEILRHAAQASSSVLILEDDVDFAPGARSWHRSPDTDICYGGYTAVDPLNLIRSDIVGAHCMGFSKRAVRALVPFLERLLNHESPPPIDGAYVWFRREHFEFITSFADPVVAVQRPSRSDITPHKLDRVIWLRRPLSIARSVKRKLQRHPLISI